jgi:hypothetical protein
MFLRSVLFACGVLAVVSPAAGQANAVCEDANFRIYFSHDSDALDADGQRMLDVAERSVAGCAYAELHVRVDGAHARQRGQAIVAASAGRSWDVARVEQRVARAEPVSLGDGPDYAEVVMTPNHLPAGAPPIEDDADIGV